MHNGDLSFMSSENAGSSFTRPVKNHCIGNMNAITDLKGATEKANDGLSILVAAAIIGYGLLWELLCVTQFTLRNLLPIPEASDIICGQNKLFRLALELLA